MNFGLGLWCERRHNRMRAARVRVSVPWVRSPTIDLIRREMVNAASAINEAAKRQGKPKPPRS